MNIQKIGNLIPLVNGNALLESDIKNVYHNTIELTNNVSNYLQPITVDFQPKLVIFLAVRPTAQMYNFMSSNQYAIFSCIRNDFPNLSTPTYQFSCLTKDNNGNNGFYGSNSSTIKGGIDIQPNGNNYDVVIGYNDIITGTPLVILGFTQGTRKATYDVFILG